MHFRNSGQHTNSHTFMGVRGLLLKNVMFLIKDDSGLVGHIVSTEPRPNNATSKSTAATLVTGFCAYYEHGRAPKHFMMMAECRRWRTENLAERLMALVYKAHSQPISACCEQIKPVLSAHFRTTPRKEFLLWKSFLFAISVKMSVSLVLFWRYSCLCYYSDRKKNSKLIK